MNRDWFVSGLRTAWAREGISECDALVIQLLIKALSDKDDEGGHQGHERIEPHLTQLLQEVLQRIASSDEEWVAALRDQLSSHGITQYDLVSMGTPRSSRERTMTVLMRVLGDVLGHEHPVLLDIRNFFDAERTVITQRFLRFLYVVYDTGLRAELEQWRAPHAWLRCGTVWLHVSLDEYEYRIEFLLSPDTSHGTIRNPYVVFACRNDEKGLGARLHASNMLLPEAWEAIEHVCRVWVHSPQQAMGDLSPLRPAALW